MAVLLQLGKQLAEILVQAVQMPRSLAARQGAQHRIPVLYHVYSFRSYRQVGRRGAWTAPPLIRTSMGLKDIGQHACAVVWVSAIPTGMGVKAGGGSTSLKP